MIVEERTYDLAVGHLGEYVANYAAKGLPVSRRHGLQLAAYWRVEAPNLHQVVHHWLHESLGHRQRIRGPRDRDPDWLAYQAGAKGLVTRQEVRFHAVVGDIPPFQRPAHGALDTHVVEELRYRCLPFQADVVARRCDGALARRLEAGGGRCLGTMVSVTGGLDEVVQFWAWDSHGACEDGWQSAAQDDRAFGRDIAGALTGRERRFLRGISPSPWI